jgi:hypothetical protein
LEHATWRFHGFDLLSPHRGDLTYEVRDEHRASGERLWRHSENDPLL